MSARPICFVILSVVLSLASPSLDFGEAETTAGDNAEAETETEGLTPPTPASPTAGYDGCDGVGCTVTEEEDISIAFRLTRNVDQSPAYQRPQYFVLHENPELYRCAPTLEVVDFPTLEGGQEYVIPKVRLFRCGGCCNDKEFACKPTNTSAVIFQVEVKVYQFANKTGSASQSVREVAMENHTACRCACNRKCHENQTLNSHTCECACAERQPRCPENHRWNRTRCACACDVRRLKHACDRNATAVDRTTCSCVLQSKLNGPKLNGDRTSQKMRPSEVVPDGQVVYRKRSLVE